MMNRIRNEEIKSCANWQGSKFIYQHETPTFISGRANFATLSACMKDFLQYISRVVDVFKQLECVMKSI